MRQLYALFVLILPALVFGQPACRFSVDLDYLYWRPCSDSFFIALQRTVDTTVESEDIDVGFPVTLTALTSSKAHSKIKTDCDRPSSGTRLTFSVPCANCWTANVVWTQFDTTNSCHERVDDENEQLIEKHLIPFTGVPSILQSGETTESALANRIKGKWKLDLDFVDIQMKSCLQFGECLRIQPHIDLRIASFKQDLAIEMEGQFLVDSSFGILDSGNFEGEKDFINHFCGAGPRIGCRAEWNLFCGCYLFGHLAPSLLYGRQTVDEDQILNLLNPSTKQPTSGDLETKTRSRRHCSKAFVDLGIGLGWDGCFLMRQAPLHLAIGWDFLYAFNQNVADANEVNVFVSHDNHDVALQGLTITLGVGF